MVTSHTGESIDHIGVTFDAYFMLPDGQKTSFPFSVKGANLCTGATINVPTLVTSSLTYTLGRPAMNQLLDVSDPNVSAGWSITGSGTCNIDAYSVSVVKTAGTASDTSIFTWSDADNNNRNVAWSTSDSQYKGTYTITTTGYSGCV